MALEESECLADPPQVHTCIINEAKNVAQDGSKRGGEFPPRIAYIDAVEMIRMTTSTWRSNRGHENKHQASPQGKFTMFDANQNAITPVFS